MKTKKVTAADGLQQQLEEALLKRQYSPGDRLPSEREIMKQFKVGRGTVRAAYRSLQQKGLIEIRHGGGAFVQEIDSSVVGDTISTLIRHRRISTQHMQEFREAIEIRCAAYAAERATKEQISNLKFLFGQMEGMLRPSGSWNLRFYELELKLHTELAKMSGNPMFEWVASTFEQNAEGFSDIIAQHLEAPAEVLRDWRNFIQAVENREVTKASRIIGSHIFRFGTILEDLKQKKKLGHSFKD
ncbi:MAG: FadR family transcriptional regulator [Desulfobacteraceae bacterium]|nr:FadR family transcriptional regulator [Desulfobacteraceae bacterium]